MHLEYLFNQNNWLGDFTANLFADAVVAVILGFILFRRIEQSQRRKERKENHKVIASLIASELKYNKEQVQSLIDNIPKGNVIFPALSSSVWDSIDKPDFINFYKPQDLADTLSIYRKIKSINKMYDALLEASNWAATGRVSIVRQEFVDIFIKNCNGLLNMLSDFFKGIERKREIKKNGLIYEGITVKQKGFFWRLVPWFSHTAQAILPNVYVPEIIYEDLTRIRSNAEYVATLEHEKTHIERQRKMGLFIFIAKYFLFPKFRYKEELLAYKSSIRYRKQKKLDFDTDKVAKSLSSWLYLRMVSHDKAKKDLDKEWKKSIKGKSPLN